MSSQTTPPSEIGVDYIALQSIFDLFGLYLVADVATPNMHVLPS